MEKLKIRFKNNFFLFILMPIILIIGYISFNRFIINHDYMISYEGDCDPVIENCYIGCEDDECNEKYFYTKIFKYAPDLYEQCGNTIVGCDSANICFINDKNCSISYCDLEFESNLCESEDGSSIIDANTEESLSEKNTLQDNNFINI